MWKTQSKATKEAISTRLMLTVHGIFVHNHELTETPKRVLLVVEVHEKHRSDLRDNVRFWAFKPWPWLLSVNQISILVRQLQYIFKA